MDRFHSQDSRESKQHHVVSFPFKLCPKPALPRLKASTPRALCGHGMPVVPVPSQPRGDEDLHLRRVPSSWQPTWEQVHVLCSEIKLGFSWEDEGVDSAVLTSYT